MFQIMSTRKDWGKAMLAPMLKLSVIFTLSKYDQLSSIIAQVMRRQCSAKKCDLIAMTSLKSIVA